MSGDVYGPLESWAEVVAAAESETSTPAAAPAKGTQKPRVRAGQKVSEAESDDDQVVLYPHIGHQI